MRIVSPSPTRILWSRLAIRDSAAIGSPWEPVQISVALLAGIRSSWSSGTIEVLRARRGSRGPGPPPCCAPSSGPRRRPCGRGRGSASSTCWMRCTWLAKLETITRRGAVRKTCSMAGVRSRSDGREAGHLGVGGVDEEQVDALVGEPGEAAQVGDPLVEGELVHLEVAGVQHQAGPGADADGEAVGDGVVDREELQVEGPVGRLVAVALLDLVELRDDPVLLELLLDQRQGQPRADDGDVGALAQQVGHAADVVLVAVGQHDARRPCRGGPGSS